MPAEMTSRQRLLCALEGGKPDRLPASVHQWQPYHLDQYLGGASALAAFERFGLDAQIQYFESMGQFWLVDADFARFSTPQWIDEAIVLSGDPDNRIVHHEIRTPEGKLAYKTAGDRKTTWITEYLLKHDEDIDLLRKYMPVPRLDLAPVAALREAVGDRGIVRGFVWGDQAGCWPHACCLMDISTLLMRCLDQPDWVHDLLNVLLEKKLRFIESMRGAAFDLVETGGGASSSTVLSPRLHEQFCLPYDRKLHDALHELGFRVTYHTCGGTLGIEEHVVANGCDVSETLAPRSVGGNQEPWDYAAKIAGRVALIGGVDQHNVLTRGGPAEIEKTVRRLFETVGPNGGYVCSPSDHFFDTPPEQIALFSQAARRCVY